MVCVRKSTAPGPNRHLPDHPGNSIIAKKLLALLFLWVGLAAPATAAPSTDRPNFLFLYTDDQRWDALGVVQLEQGNRARFPWFQTPNLDRLAAEGVRFRNAFVTLSLSAPSRAAILTGRYNHSNGIANNRTPFPTNSVTWATQLRSAGYTTAYIGKWHMDTQRGQRPGFDYSASFIGQARYTNTPFEINGVSKPTQGWVDDASTDYAIAFIRRLKGKPWAMTVGFKSPHGPCQPPERWKDKFADGYARPVPNLNVTPPFAATNRANRASVAVAGPPGALRANLNYFRCLAAVDENIGRLLRELETLGLADDTMVIYSSDNGFYFGEHQLGDKRSAYDESLRVPMLVRYPRLGVRGKLRDDLVLNIDIPATLLDFAGVPVPKEFQGRSWRPLLEGRAADWRRSFFYEYFRERNYAAPSLTAVRTATAKLIKYKDHDEWTELFDLAADPYETKNLYRDASAARLRADLEGEYERQKQAVGFVWPSYADDPGTLEPGRSPDAWVLDYRFDQDAGDTVRDGSGHGNHGTAQGVALVEGRDGRKARRFDGQGVIVVPKAMSLNPAQSNWTVEVTFKADQPDGIVLAHGGASFGYCLALEEGAPVFAVVGNQKLSRVAANQNVTGQWTTLRAQILPGAIALTLNGQPAGRAPLKASISREPNDILNIGADLGSVVLGKNRPHFSGLIESVRIYGGDVTRAADQK
jgi:arylsulfatase A-like enzyme